jgi:anti-sigma B factor antagonist
MTAGDLDRQPTATVPLIHSVASPGSTVVLVLVGEVDFATSDEFRRRLGDLIESSDAPVVVVDLSEVQFIDAAAVGVIVSARAAVAACGRNLYVDGLRAGPARVFEILGLDWLRLPHRGQRMLLSRQ